MVLLVEWSQYIQPKSTDIFHISSHKKNMLWYSLEVPHQSASNEYPQHIFVENW